MEYSKVHTRAANRPFWRNCRGRIAPNLAMEEAVGEYDTHVGQCVQKIDRSPRLSILRRFHECSMIFNNANHRSAAVMESNQAQCAREM
jgi:hypothetical protein